MHGATPTGPSKSGAWPVGMLAITLGGLVVRSKTTTVLLALPTNMVFPSAVTTIPQGQDKGFTPLARAAQHCAPVNPPKSPLAPKPGIEKSRVRQPKRVWLPSAERNGGIVPGPDGPLIHALALFPAWDTALAPPIVFTARFLTVSTTTTAKPMRSDT